MQETQEMWVRSPGQEDSSEEGIATDFSYLAWEIPWTRGAWWATVHGLQRVRHNLATNTHSQQGYREISYLWEQLIKLHF